ncbi:SHOCT domain-containing protein [Halomarina litorea]|uniref:SHOCT domain-containing protein n=1 Tax=Halomarina litorea TaxID=2961595 RepID=UPI0020C3933A|nr:SHOCT domain-containing protein [Halomarina sp. BCD28]
MTTSTKRLFGWIGGGLIVLTVLMLGLAMTAGNQMTGGWWMPHMGGGWSGMGGWGIGMLLLGILWMVLLVALPVALVYGLLSDRGGPRSDSAMEVLREQYARGEIDEEEYESRRRRLSEQ